MDIIYKNYIMKKSIFITWVLLLLSIITLKAQDDVSLFNYWQYNSDVENSLYKHFCSVAFDQLKSRDAEIEKLITKEDWLERQSTVKRKLAEIIGPFPEKTPLNDIVTGKLKKDGYRIEKITYESQPGYHVTGAIYIPDGVKKKAPAIFYACGHSVEGFKVNVYQHIIINLVKKGFVVFTIDPMGQGERFEYWDTIKDEPKFPIPDHEHSYAGAQCIISGYSTGRNFIWDAIRGIDYMISRKEIDPERIGMTGRSGGGNITAYLGAIDNRILATAPECYITSYEYIYKSIGPQCAEQNLYQMIEKGLDHQDFIEARAPKPTMMITTSRDFFSIQGARESYAEAKKMYKTLNAESALLMVEDDTVHKSTIKNREAMYAFFQKYLNNPGNSKDIVVNVPDPEDLQVTKTGHVVGSLNGESVFSLNKAIVEKQLISLETSRTDQSRHLKKIPSAAARYSGFEQPVSFGKPVFSGRYVKAAYTMEKYLLPGSGDYALPVILFRPEVKFKNELILIVNTDGLEQAVNHDGLVHQLLKKGYSVLISDLPGIGSMGPGYLKGDSYIGGISYNQWFAAALVGKSNVGLRAEDILRLIHFAKNDIKEFSSISAISIGALGSEMLHAATFSPEIKNICLIRPFLSYADIATTRFYKPDYIPYTVPGAIKEYDLTDLIAGLCPRKVIIIDPLTGDGTTPDEEKIRNNYLFPNKVYSEKGVTENFKVVNNSDNQEISSQIFNWLR
jgi:Acetyl xylan esterase (AXE1)